MASLDDIVAMKVEVISGGGRIKDFWDLHELMDIYSIEQMIALHAERYPYGHEEEEIRAGFVDFKKADEEFPPVCHRGKHWDFVRADFKKALA
jgi:hypothetical protein